ncbi:MAG: peroxide stress protein YaaA [Pseudomonadota bacterium]
MLVVVSPAKRLDWSVVAIESVTEPAFQDDAVHLAKVASKLSKPKLQALMSISVDLAKLNQDRFRAFQPETPDDARPAAFAFAGDTYQGLEARTLDPDALSWAQSHLRILSGLYGILRPLDLIQPYRLEMGSRLKTGRKENLYAYWGSRLAEALDQQAETTGSTVLVNCASQEYFGAVDLKTLKLDVITPTFLEEKNGKGQIVSFFAKRARGAMARFIVERRITEPQALWDFDTGGYAYQPDQSTPDKPVFMRTAEAAKAA